MRAFLCFAAVCLSLLLSSAVRGQPANSRADEEEENEVDNGSDSDLYSGLVHLGAAIFGTPDVKSGEAVSAWKDGSPFNPEEMGEYAEGDILHPIGNSRNGLKATSSRWPKGVIPYEISPYFGNRDVSRYASIVFTSYLSGDVREFERFYSYLYIMYGTSSINTAASI